MDTILLLCDHAVAAEGKLYVNGGGWDRVAAGPLIQVGLAVLITVPWDQTNIRHTVELSLITEDGEPVLDPEGNQWRATGQFELGRPAGIRQGSTQAMPMGVNFPGIVFAPGGYRWEVKVNDQVETTASFEAIGMNQ